MYRTACPSLLAFCCVSVILSHLVHVCLSAWQSVCVFTSLDFVLLVSIVLHFFSLFQSISVQWHVLMCGLSVTAGARLPFTKTSSFIFSFYQRLSISFIFFVSYFVCLRLSFSSGSFACEALVPFHLSMSFPVPSHFSSLSYFFGLYCIFLLLAVWTIASYIMFIVPLDTLYGVLDVQFSVRLCVPLFSFQESAFMYIWTSRSLFHVLTPSLSSVLIQCLLP